MRYIVAVIAVVGVVLLVGCADTAPPSQKATPQSRFVVEEDHFNWRILRDVKTQRLYYQGSTASCAGFYEINQTPIALSPEQAPHLPVN